MDYVRIRQRDNGTTRQQGLVTEPVEVPTPHSSQLTVEDVKEFLKDWIKLYPNSFASDVDFKIYKLASGDIIIQLHEDLSSMAVSLLVLYLENISRKDAESQCRKELVSESVEAPTTDRQQPIAYITIDDTEVLLKQNIGKRAMVFCELGIRNEELGIETRETTSIKKAQNSQLTAHSSVRFLLDDNYVLDYNFEKRPQPVKDCDMVFEEPEFSLPEEYESVRVGDVVKKKIDEVLDEGLTPKKMLAYLLCGAIGLGIGFLIVYFMGK